MRSGREKDVAVVCCLDALMMRVFFPLDVVSIACSSCVVLPRLYRYVPALDAVFRPDIYLENNLVKHQLGRKESEAVGPSKEKPMQ